MMSSLAGRLALLVLLMLRRKPKIGAMDGISLHGDAGEGAGAGEQEERAGPSLASPSPWPSSQTRLPRRRTRAATPAKPGIDRGWGANVRPCGRRESPGPGVGGGGR
jgi:hypothetical protein